MESSGNVTKCNETEQLSQRTSLLEKIKYFMSLRHKDLRHNPKENAFDNFSPIDNDCLSRWIDYASQMLAGGKGTGCDKPQLFAQHFDNLNRQLRKKRVSHTHVWGSLTAKH